MKIMTGRKPIGPLVKYARQLDSNRERQKRCFGFYSAGSEINVLLSTPEKEYAEQ